MGKEGLLPGSVAKRVTGTTEGRLYSWLVELKSTLQELSYNFIKANRQFCLKRIERSKSCQYFGLSGAR